MLTTFAPEFSILCLGTFVGCILGFGFSKTDGNLKAGVTVLGVAFGGGPILFMKHVQDARWSYPVGLIIGLLIVHAFAARSIVIDRRTSLRKRILAWLDIVVIAGLSFVAATYTFVVITASDTQLITSVYSDLQEFTEEYRRDFYDDSGTRSSSMVEIMEDLVDRAKELPTDGTHDSKVYRGYTVARIMTYAAQTHELHARRGTGIAGCTQHEALVQANALCNDALLAIGKTQDLMQSGLSPQFQSMPQFLLHDKALCLAIKAKIANSSDAILRESTSLTDLKASACTLLAELKTEYKTWSTKSGIMDEPLIKILACSTK